MRQAHDFGRGVFHLCDRHTTLDAVGSICVTGTRLVKHGIEFAGAVKGIYDVGKVVYSGFVAAAPYLEAAMLAGL